MSEPKLPAAPASIQKGVPLKLVLDLGAVSQLGLNLKMVHATFDAEAFEKDCMNGIEELALKDRGYHIAAVLKNHLPNYYTEAIGILLASLTPPLSQTTDLGLSGMFYMPHISFIERYGLDISYNNQKDPFDISMRAQYELTKRFTAEFSIRAFIANQPKRTFDQLYLWMNDPDPHVRRLCSEGTRPRLPWASKLVDLAKDPSPSLPILELLKNDPDLYVRRSVANHLGDIAKDHMDLALDLCENWLTDASKELKWVIRHALRNPAKKKIIRALDIRLRAKP
ncbi:DNA alkylation repair protein [Bacteroidia bacterium]|jgi:3-methyladenine DNA glycosylase AlkC|nr:DNA alkylation repair protein [Bacteroidia bacterium]